MDDKCYELRIDVKTDDALVCDVIRCLLVSGGCCETDIAEYQREGRRSLRVYFSDAKSAQRSYGSIKKAGLKKIRVSLNPLFPADWRDKWKRSFKPFSLTKKYCIVPIWQRKAYQHLKKDPIFLDTVLAFGTGLHETTCFMAQIVERLEGNFKSAFDIGTGTGILSLVAKKYGAKTLYLTDIDPVSIDTAKANFNVNGMIWDWAKPQDFRACRIRRTFDLVLANIVTDELIALREKMIARVSPGQYLAVSGISIPNLNRFKQAFGGKPLRCQKVYKGKKWCAILYRKVSHAK